MLTRDEIQRTLKIIDVAFLPTNPNKMRTAAPEVVSAAKWFKENRERLSIDEAQRTELADALARVSDIPCCKCGGEVIEFSVPNETWNKIVREDGPETDQEYLCVQCFAFKCLARVKVLEGKNATQKHLQECMRTFLTERFPDALRAYDMSELQYDERQEEPWGDDYEEKP